MADIVDLLIEFREGVPEILARNFAADAGLSVVSMIMNKTPKYPVMQATTSRGPEEIMQKINGNEIIAATYSNLFGTYTSENAYLPYQRKG
ncbi:hypothetical protein HYU11_04950 [Candidatus Woesearchaeota archaeon]|nr:hypothetical protein [Candidatus Woesearchaeota archaeon]